MPILQDCSTMDSTPELPHHEANLSMVASPTQGIKFDKNGAIIGATLHPQFENVFSIVDNSDQITGHLKRRRCEVDGREGWMDVHLNNGMEVRFISPTDPADTRISGECRLDEEWFPLHESEGTHGTSCSDQDGNIKRVKCDE